jgi:phytoene desaturase
MKQRVVIIGSGFGGLGSACLLAKSGYDVTLLEKNESCGGRASVFTEKGYTFDMGPSWYLMPDVFEQFFRLMDERVEEHLDLKKLSPSYRVFFKDVEKNGVSPFCVDLTSDVEKDVHIFEQLEPGSGKKLREYLASAAYQYSIAKDRFMYKNYDSIFDFLNRDTLIEGRKLSVFQSMDRYVRRFFHSDEIQKIMQYTLVFLGSSPFNTPALYNIMSHIDFNMGVYYPMGGIYTIIEALVRIAKKHGVTIRTDATVTRIVFENGRAVGVELKNGETVPADIVISNADIHHTETDLLPPAAREYSATYWKKRVLAPSAFMMYLGIDGRIPTLTHHNLIFSKDWKKNFGEIFDHPQWPTDPSLYVCAPSVSDPSVAPPNKENICVLVPIAAGLTYTDADLEAYGEKVLTTLEQEMRIPELRKRVEYKKFFCVKDFATRYNSYQGTALGLAHTLRQTALFRPNNISKKVKNLFYVGANTNPGIGMPVCLISAELVWKRIMEDTTPGPIPTLQQTEEIPQTY